MFAELSSRAHLSHNNIGGGVSTMSFNTAMTRRSFVSCAGALSTMSVLGLPGLASGGTQRRFKRGLQLYTVREPMAKDAVGTLKVIADIGYEDLETYGFDPEQVSYYGFEARKFKELLEARGLTSS